MISKFSIIILLNFQSISKISNMTIYIDQINIISHGYSLDPIPHFNINNIFISFFILMFADVFLFLESHLHL